MVNLRGKNNLIGELRILRLIVAVTRVRTEQLEGEKKGERKEGGENKRL
jgi:hypothetical protein